MPGELIILVVSEPKGILKPPLEEVPKLLYVDWLTSTALWEGPNIKRIESPTLTTILEGLKLFPIVWMVWVVAYINVENNRIIKVV